MQSATNPAQGWPTTADALIRPAQPTDQAAIMGLLDSALNVHYHADWQDPLAWIGEPGTVVHERAGRVRCYLAATLDPPPVAWLRVIALDQLDPAEMFARLCDQALAALRPVGVVQLACLSARAWTDRVLHLYGFRPTHAIEELVRAEAPPPILAHGAVMVRAARPGEYNQIAALDAAAFDAPLWWHSVGQLARAAEQTVAFDVAFVGNELAGYHYSVRTAAHQAHIVRVAVGPRWQGYGVGSALLAQALQTLWQYGLRRVTLNMQTANEAARRLYERYGFEATGTRYPVYTLDL